jgi:hypothetical protein
MSDTEFTTFFARLLKDKALINRVGIREALHSYGIKNDSEQLILGRKISTSAKEGKAASYLAADQELYSFVLSESKDMVDRLERMPLAA